MMTRHLFKVCFNINFIFIFLAIKTVCPKTTNYLCSWHLQQNLKKKFSFLNKSNKNQTKEETIEKIILYDQIINLPFSDYIDDFEEQGIRGTVSLHRNIPCIHRAHTVLYRSLTVHSPCTHLASPFIYRAR